MNTIQANSRNTRFIEVSDRHLQTIKEYNLFNQLPNSQGLITEDILEKLRLTVRSLIAAEEENSKNLLDLCLDVIYHKDMKAFGLNQLYQLYKDRYTSNTKETNEFVK